MLDDLAERHRAEVVEVEPHVAGLDLLGGEPGERGVLRHDDQPVVRALRGPGLLLRGGGGGVAAPVAGGAGGAGGAGEEQAEEEGPGRVVGEGSVHRSGAHGAWPDRRGRAF